MPCTSHTHATCQALDKLADKSIVVFDSLLASYHLLADTVRSQPPEKEIEFLLIDCTQVGTCQHRCECVCGGSSGGGGDVGLWGKQL